MEEKKEIGVLDYPECLDALLPYMDWLEGTDEEKKAYLLLFVNRAATA